MFIWQGLGFLVVLIPFGVLIAFQLVTGWSSGDEHYYQLHAWPKVAGLILAAAILSLVARLRTRV